MNVADWTFEHKYWQQGYKTVCGLDEVGRGSWAGPVVTAAVVFPENISFPEPLYDSKLISPQKRNHLTNLIYQLSAFVSVGTVGVNYINNHGIGKAAQKSFRQALRRLPQKPDFHLIDAFYIKYINKSVQFPIIKGDQLCASIAAASIVAKVYRDQLMVNLHNNYPDYRFDLHKGYGTKLHQEMIKKHGLSSVHRQSFNLAYLLT